MVKEGLLYGYVNAKGEYVITPQFEEAQSFSEGLAAVKIDNKWGYIDTTGKFIITPQFQEAYYFGENQYYGMARIIKNNKWGVINKSGKFVVPAEYLGFYVSEINEWRLIKGYNESFDGVFGAPIIKEFGRNGKIY